MDTNEILQLARSCKHPYGTPDTPENWEKFLIAFANAIENRTLERAAGICNDMVLYTGFDCAAAIREEMK